MFFFFKRVFEPLLGPQGGCASSRLDHGVTAANKNIANCTRVTSPKGAKTCIFSNIWPLARPNIAKRKPLLLKKNLLASRLALASGGNPSIFRTSKKLKP